MTDLEITQQTEGDWTAKPALENTSGRELLIASISIDFSDDNEAHGKGRGVVTGDILWAATTDVTSAESVDGKRTRIRLTWPNDPLKLPAGQSRTISFGTTVPFADAPLDNLRVEFTEKQ
ncbi:hypothetical protein OG818_21940 [Streptomyces virginiae]|uniref:hypothetical protein n=1 Tax=Streptomyces virginiae TaxID=1961 RepID=UPI002256D87C|nr:hypothetical protein [Streptomyces virginiae]MCX4718425.1 hypothetical protein [Streptomyces virginiae]